MQRLKCFGSGSLVAAIRVVMIGGVAALPGAVGKAIADGPCEPFWDNTIGQPGVAGIVRALAVDEGSAGNEPALYAGGGFQTAGGVAAVNIAKWDGQRWSALGSGVNFEILSMALLDDDGTPESAPALYAGGHFTVAGRVEANHIARWDGNSGEWSPLGSGMNASVDAITSFDDGSGLSLYAGGNFTMAGGIEANRIAKWDSASAEWSALGSGVSGEDFFHGVLALTVFDDGTPGNGPALYAGGHFTVAGGVEVNHIAKWDGASGEWSALGSGMNGAVHALTVFDDGSPGSGPALYAGGNFTTAGGETVNFIAKWNADSGEWSALGGGLNNAVRGLAVFDDGAPGSEPALYAGGVFTTAGGVSANFIAKWDPATEEWSALEGGVDGSVRALAVFDDGAPGTPDSWPALYAGGTFTTASGLPSSRIAGWSAPQPGCCKPHWDNTLGQPGMNDRIMALIVFDDAPGTPESGGGPALIAGGQFTSAGGVPAGGVAMWDGESWTPMGRSLPNSVVLALAVYDSGAGPELYGGGTGAAAGVARWTGAEWADVPGAPTSWIGALHVHDAGDGPELYVSGAFINLPTLDGPTDYIARYDGVNWRAVGGGLNSVVNAFAAFDAGDGPALFAVGLFSLADPGVPTVIGFGKFDGKSWSAAGGGFNTGALYALTAHDDGGGPALFAGGDFTVAGGVTVNFGGTAANRIAKWDGAEWFALGDGMNDDVLALAVFDEDGDGPGPPALFAAGEFTMAGGVLVNHIAKWDGKQWSAVGGGTNQPVAALTVYSPTPAPGSDGSGVGPGLYAGGEFGTAGGETANRIAKWQGCASLLCVADFVSSSTFQPPGDGTVDAADLAFLLGEWGDVSGGGGGSLADIVTSATFQPPADGVVDGADLAVLLGAWGVCE
jgi:hypothetical protein